MEQVAQVQGKICYEVSRNLIDDWNNGNLSFIKLNGQVKFSKEVSVKVFEKPENVGVSMTLRHPHLLYHYDHLSVKDPAKGVLCVVERAVPDLEAVIGTKPRLFSSKNNVSVQLKKNIRGLVNALSLIQAMGMVHGNIKLASIWTVCAGTNYFKLKLNVLGDDLHGAMITHAGDEDEMKKDWFDLGATILQMLDVIRSSDLEQTNLLVVELDDLCKLMKGGNFKSNNVKRSLLLHPFFWGDERFSLLVNFCNTVKSMNWTGYVDESSEADNIRPNQWTSQVEPKLLKYMNTSRKDHTGEYDGTSAWGYLLFMRIVLEHFYTFPDEVKGVLPKTREQILRMFMKLQPNTILALWRLTREWIDRYDWCLKNICSFIGPAEASP